MVDFRKMMDKRKKEDPIIPYEIFKRLSPEKINDLWHSQQVILEEWYSRRNESDLVIKLNTGGGKTIIGLLIAQSIINETKGSVLYLCPNKQLVMQTIDKANAYGIEVQEYKKEIGIPVGFRSGKKIMIATYSALFNGLSKFGIDGEIDICNVEGIIIDDAHTAESLIREQFTIKIDFRKNKDMYDEIIGVFREAFKEMDRVALFDDVVDGKDSKVLEVPYWSWKEKEEQVRSLLQDNSQEFKFQWRLIRDNLKYCNCLISSREINITPIYPMINLFPTFKYCNKRIYMSATLSNDSSIIRTFDADPKSILKPIEISSNISMGERMILAPALMKIDSNPKSIINEIVKDISEKFGVIILVPYSDRANQWKEIAEYADKSEKVLLQVESMTKENNKGPFIWANRYDGIDLPEDTCRLLIISGKPGIMSSYDRYMASILNGSSLINNIIAQRLEQGLGRATRGAGDYCVILFEGDDIVNWISEKSNLDLLSKSTRAQLDMGHDISNEIDTIDNLRQTINQCYDRESSWTTYHANILADTTEINIDNENSINEAGKEREFFKNYLHGDINIAKQDLEELIKIVSDDKMKSWYLQNLARLYNETGDRSKSNELQKKAYKLNTQLNKPISRIQYELLREPSRQSRKILENLNMYSYKRGFLTEISRINSKLVDKSTANQFEEALQKLGEIIGFESERPEYKYGEGPDVLWRIDKNKFFIIECKSKKESYNPYSKKENGQLLESYEWFKSKYENAEGIKISVHPKSLRTKGAHTNNIRVMDFKLLNKLKDNVQSLFLELCDLDLDDESMIRICDSLLDKYKLKSNYLFSEYTTIFKHLEGK